MAAAVVLETLLFGTVVVVRAQQASQVQAALCSTTGPDIRVHNAISDTVVTTPTITIEGTAQQTSQIDVYVNNAYSNSLAISRDTTFEIPLTLSEGTNTIRLEAFFSCNHTSTSVGLVVDFRPIPSPSSSINTDTIIPTESMSVTGSIQSEVQASKLLTFVLSLLALAGIGVPLSLVFISTKTVETIISHTWLSGRISVRIRHIIICGAVVTLAALFLLLLLT